MATDDDDNDDDNNDVLSRPYHHLLSLTATIVASQFFFGVETNHMWPMWNSCHGVQKILRTIDRLIAQSVDTTKPIASTTPRVTYTCTHSQMREEAC